MGAFNKTASSATDFEMPPIGQHVGHCVALIDLGTQERIFQGKAARVEEVYLAWELTDLKRKDGSNYVVARSYTNSLNVKSHLRQMIDGLRASVGKAALADGEGYTLTNLVGPKYVVTIEYTQNKDKTKTYYNVKSVGAAHKSIAVPAATHKPVVWEIGSDQPVPDLDWLPRVFGSTVRDLVESSVEFKAGVVGNGDAAEGARQEEEIPY